MLRGIHKASSTWLGKSVLAVIMGFLVISFAVWGIGDIFRGFGQSSAIEVGDTEISTRELQDYYNDQLRLISRRLGRPLTPAQARALGIDQQVLGQLVADTAFNQDAKQLRLAVTDAEVARRITSDPNFAGPDGQFDRRRFEDIINRAGYTEGRFVAEQRNVMLRRQIAQSLAGELTVPTTAKKAINRFQNETREISYLMLGPAQAGDVPAPDAETLTQYFADHKALFRAPEYRKIVLLPLSPSDIAKVDAVSDAEAKTYYEQHKSDFGRPEKRELSQIVFSNEQEAKAARERIDKGLSFADLAKERGLKDTDTAIGTVAKTGIIDPAIADAAFALKSGEVSQPVKGQFGTVLLKVGKIEPGEQKTYEQVAAQIKQTLAENRAKVEIETLRDKIEDERAAGSTLIETGKKLGLKTRAVDAIDRSGRDPAGQPVKDLPTQPNVVASAFATDVGVDDEALQLPAGGYIYFSVTGITPSRERKLDEVKDKVVERWRNDEIAKRLKTKSDDMVAKLKTGTTLAELASADGLTVQSASDLQRGKPAGFLPASVVEAAFRTPQDAVAAAQGKSETERTVFRVTGVTDPPFNADSEADKKITATLITSYSDDIAGQYLVHLQKELGVTINQSAVSQAIGGAQ